VKKVLISPSARLDLLEIDLQTLDLFGYDQSEATVGEFQRVFQLLADHPELGEACPEVSPPGKTLRMWTVLKRFVIIYEDAGSVVKIVRIVDGAQDLPRLFSNE